MRLTRRKALAAVLAAAAAPASRARAAAWDPVTFKSAFGDEVAAEQTTLSVPERHAGATGGRISLPVLRFRSTAAQPGPPIVYLAGGPGGSGLESVRAGPFTSFMAMRAYADLVVFDQRGTGGAQPSLSLPGGYDLPPDKGLRDPAVVARFRQIATDGAAEIKARGIDLAAYNTAESAEDLDAVREFLGVPKIVVWGHSYGSHLGLAYIAAHPERVAAAVLSGVNDLDARWRLPSDSDGFLRRIDEAWRADPRAAGRMASFLAVVERVMGRLASRPQTVNVQGRAVAVGREELQTLIALQAGDINFVRDLPLNVARMDAGDFARPAAMLQAIRAQPLGTAMRHAMHIASGVSPARLAQIAAEAPGSLSGDAINFPYNTAAFRDPWAIPDLGESFRSRKPSDVPVLFLNGQFDGRTSPREARETASRFRNGVFAEVAGVSHDFYGFSPAVTDAMAAFLRTGAKPPQRVPALAADFRSVDEDAILKDLGGAFLTGGVKAAIAKAQTLAAATSGPWFNVSTARQAGLVLNAQLKNPAAAIDFLLAADRLYPDDFLINRILANLYRDTGQRDLARARLDTVRRINPIANGLAADLAKPS